MSQHMHNQDDMACLCLQKPSEEYTMIKSDLPKSDIFHWSVFMFFNMCTVNMNVLNVCLRLDSSIIFNGFEKQYTVGKHFNSILVIFFA